MKNKNDNLLKNPDFEITSVHYVLKVWTDETKRWHRLDAPAAIQVSKKTNKIVYQRYYVNGIGLQWFFEVVKYKKNRSQKIFDYVKNYPEHIDLVWLLARHNNWLNEKELELLTCLDMFT